MYWNVVCADAAGEGGIERNSSRYADPGDCGAFACFGQYGRVAPEEPYAEAGGEKCSGIGRKGNSNGTGSSRNVECLCLP